MVESIAISISGIIQYNLKLIHSIRTSTILIDIRSVIRDHMLDRDASREIDNIRTRIEDAYLYPPMTSIR